jgi:hypothetical protein
MTAPLGQLGGDERKKAVKKYFQITPDERERTRARHQQQAAVVFIVVAGSLVLVEIRVLAILVAMVALVLLLQGLGGMADYRRRLTAAEPKPADQLMDRTLDEDLSAAADRAMRRLGLTRDDLELHSDEVEPPAEPRRARPRLADQGRGPLVVFGPAQRARGRSGADRVWRFTRYDVMVICPTGHHLAIYECVLDFASGRRKDEETYEFHYADVVAVSTRTRERAELGLELVYSSSFAVPLHRTMTREFEIVVSSGDRSAIVVGIRDDDLHAHQLVLQESGIDHVTAAVRRMLRTKKGAPTR